jgi:hypothetical protein
MRRLNGHRPVAIIAITQEPKLSEGRPRAVQSWALSLAVAKVRLSAVQLEQPEAVSRTMFVNRTT